MCKINTMSKKGGNIFINQKLKDKNFINLNIRNLEKSVVVINVGFWSYKDEPDLTVSVGLLPEVNTIVNIPLTCLDGQTLFLKPNGVELKSIVRGVRVDPNSVTKIGIMYPEYYKDVSLEINEFKASETELEKSVGKVKLVDEFGQWKISDWQGKTKNLSEFIDRITQKITKEDNVGYSKGYFNILNEDGRYYLSDPNGKLFFSSGVDCVNCNESSRCEGLETVFDRIVEEKNIVSFYGKENMSSMCFIKENFKRGFGEDWKRVWENYVCNCLKAWGFNTIAAWSDDSIIKYSKMPYTIVLNQYPKTSECIYRDFPDVFSEEFEKNSRLYAKQIIEYSDDHNLIGYFMSNEPNFAFEAKLNLGYELLINKNNLESKQHLVAYLKKKYININNLNLRWETNFESFDSLYSLKECVCISQAGLDELQEYSKILMKRFIEIPALSIKEYDTNHLNLGIRYAWISNEVLLSGMEYVDVVSINCYKFNCSEEVNKLYNKIKKPVMIGEYHFGSIDRGLLATGIRGVENQNERAIAAKYYLENALANKYCVGIHYFQLYDENVMGRFDGENYQIGLLDVCSNEYKEITSAFKEVHSKMYDIMSGKILPTNIKPKSIPPIF